LRFGLPDLWWRAELGGPYPLSIAAAPVTEPTVDGTAVEAITVAVADRYRLAPRVVWGNVASAVNTTARLITTTRPDLTAVTNSAANAILTDPRIEDGALRVGPHFQRRSCCLIYRLAGTRAAVCGDCVLTPRP
jgi:ferric iron reductase protein FhuF